MKGRIHSIETFGAVDQHGNPDSLFYAGMPCQVSVLP